MMAKATHPTAADTVKFLAMMRRHPFRVGQRVRPSAYGIEHLIFPGKKAEASGVVTKVDEFNSPTVLWDYRRTASSYFAGFIEPDRRRKRPGAPDA